MRVAPKGFMLVARVLLVVIATLGAASARADALRDGDRAFRAGQFDRALRAYQAAAAAGRAEGEAGAGLVWLRRGRLEEAMAAFRRAEQRDERLAMAYYGQGEVLRRQGHCDEAIPPLERANGLDRRFPEALLALGRCRAATGDLAGALADFDRGTRFGRAWAPRFLVARGTAWMERDSLRQAGIDFTRAREMAPGDPAIRRAIGEFYAYRGTWALAVPELEAAVALDSTDSDTRLALGRALFFAQRYDEALGTYRALVTSDPEYAPGFLGLGDLLYRAGDADPRRLEEALAPLRRYTRLAPEDPKGWSLLGRALQRAGGGDSALSVMREAERRGDTTPELFTLMGMAYAGARRYDEALAAFAKGDPGPREYLTLAQVHDLTGHPARADSIYRLYLARDSVSAGAAFAFTQRGRLRFRDRDHTGAEAMFGRALAIDPRASDAAFYRGLSLQELGRHAEALEALRVAAGLDSMRADRWFWLGVAADHEQRKPEAERAFRRCAELDPGGELAATSFRQLGYYQLLREQWHGAIEDLTRATELAPRDAQAWLWLAQGLQNAGQRARAIECYRRVLGLDPHHAAALRGLKVLKAPVGGTAAPE